MRFGRLMRSAALLAVAPVAVAGLAASPANAHGTLGDPISRVAACYAEGPENPRSEMCVRLVEENGTQPLYDWHEVNIANADGQHREIIPDGRLCSAGRDKYSALDNPGDWASTAVTSLPSGGDHTFEYTAAVPHAGYIEYYVTTDDWDPSTPLTWDELEPEPFAVDDQPVAENGSYTMTARLPQKSGQHLIYTIWQRTDSPEAFYTCSDVTFGGSSAEVTRAAADTEPFTADEAAYEDLDHLGADLVDPDRVGRAGGPGRGAGHDDHEVIAMVLGAILGFAGRPEEPNVANIHETLQNALECIGRDPRKDRIRLILNIPPNACVRMRPLALQQVLMNLILNAQAALRPRGGMICITVEELAEGLTKLVVADNGPGIAKELATKVFEPFVTGKTIAKPRNANEKPTGTGLGLAICRRIIEAHGGKVRVESEMGRGTTFLLTLPQARGEAGRE